MIKKLFFIPFLFISFLISQNVSPNLKLTKLNGRTVTLSEYLKKGPVLINFWATWCSPCKKEMVYLDKFERKYKDEGLSILSISVDSQKSLSHVRSYIRANDYIYDVFLDPNRQVFKKLNGNLMPTNVLIDTEGKVLWRHYGYIPGDEENMDLQLRSALNINP
ncbi:MAG: TlpA disulfide reductase family protein [Candidatus Neomarinimicrobiota bacterium]|nr:TlpA disulfide reductase family protein [Candidatus Neomarinimicrobiota bacterium]